MSDPIETPVEVQVTPPSPQSPPAVDPPKAFDAAYVEELRKESAKYRTELRKLQAAQDATEATKLSDLERVQKEAAELKDRLNQRETALRTERAMRAVMDEAGTFNLPGKVAARLIPPDALEYSDDGVPRAASVRAALKALADEMPELTQQARTANPARGAAGVEESDAARRARLNGGTGLNIFDPAVAAQFGGGVIFPTKD